MTYRFAITDAHIRAGCRFDEGNCAVARAVQEHFGQKRVMWQSVAPDELVVQFTNGFKMTLTPLPAMRTWIQAFDEGYDEGRVKPATLSARLLKTERTVIRPWRRAFTPEEDRRMFGDCPGVRRVMRGTRCAHVL